MRTFIINMLVTAMLVFSAASASAISITIAGAELNQSATTVGSTVSVTVTLDTEATAGITVMSIGVLFDNTRLSYNQGASSTASYALYTTGKANNFLKAAITCGGYPAGGGGCQLALAGQVNVDYVSTDLTNGTQSPQNTTAGAAIVNAQLATLVFNVTGLGSASIALSQSSPGNVIGQPGGASTTATLNGSGSVNVVPEPTTALLVALGLAGLGIAGRRRA